MYLDNWKKKNFNQEYYSSKPIINSEGKIKTPRRYWEWQKLRECNASRHTLTGILKRSSSGWKQVTLNNNWKLYEKKPKEWQKN